MKYKKFIKLLLVANVVMLVVATVFVRLHKLRQQDTKFLIQADKFASGISSESGLSKKDTLEGMLLSEHMRRDRRVSNTDLARLLSIIKLGFAKDRSGNSLIDFGSGFDRRLTVEEQQKQDIGNVCLLVIQEATKDESRLYALHIISLMRITSTRASLVPLVNDKNPEIVAIARRLTMANQSTSADATTKGR